MPRFIDHSGKRFGRLVVQSAIRRPGVVVYWECLCDCGTSFITRAENLTKGHSVSCGCFRREVTSTRNTTHGFSKGGRKFAPEYYSWRSMISRCHSGTKKGRAYNYYGARGITVCDRWRADFRNFLEDMGPRPGPGYSVEREDNSKGYSPDNCKWATWKEQQNNRRSNRFIEHGGRSQTTSNWATELSMTVGRLNYLLFYKNLTISEAMVYEQAHPYQPRKLAA